MTTVSSRFSSASVSSSRAVEIGSSAEAGSSSSRIWGSMAMARATHSRCCWPPDRLWAGRGQPVPDFAPQGDAAQRPLDQPVHLRSRHPAIQADAERDVLSDRHRERRRLLEHHADAGAQAGQVDRHRGHLGDAVAGFQPGDAGAVAQHVLAVEQDAPDRMLAGIQLVDAVERAQQRRLATPRRTDQRGDRVPLDAEIDTEQRLRPAIEEVEPARLQHHAVGGRRGDGGVGCGAHRREPGERRRPATPTASTPTAISSAPVQASWRQSS